MDDTATSGSDTREARALDEVLMSFDLERELGRLRDEPGYRDFGRASITLGKGEHVRLVLSALREGATLGSEHADGALAIQVLTGEVTVGRSERAWTYPAGTAVWMSQDGAWGIEAVSDAAVLITVGWPGSTEAAHDVV